MQVESRATVFFLAVGSYIGYKLFKKYIGCDNLTGRGHNAGILPTHDDPLATLLGNKEPKLVLDHPLENQVGQNYQFRIAYHERRRTGILFSGGNRTGSNPSNNNTAQRIQPVANLPQLLSEKTGIEVVKIIGLAAPVTIIREFEVDVETQNSILLVTFTVREAGFYDVRVKYNGNSLPDSPFLVSFVPSSLDCDQTGLIRHSPTVLFTTEIPHSLMIEPKDKFGNLCRLEDIEVDKFSFQVQHVEDSRKHEFVGAYTYNFVQCSVDDWGQVKTLIRFESEIFEPGIFRGLISYNNKLIASGSFDVITLSNEEQIILREMLKKATTGTLYHAAELHSMDTEIYKRTKTVYIYISPRLITVKEFFLGFIPSRICTYKIHPALRVQLLLNNLGQSSFKVFDRIQPTLMMEMDTTKFRLVLALFAHFLQERLGGSESFENKQKYFYQEVCNVREDKNRLFIGLRIDRNNLLESSLNAVKNFSVKEWCKKFKIHFEGEEGSDDGGLRREWLNLLCCKLFENNPEGLFCSMGNSRLVHPNPDRANTWTNLKYFELAGKIVAKCLFETAVGGHYKQMVNGRFTRSFLAQIIGFYPQTKHFEQDDPELFLGKVKYLRENNMDTNSMELTFTEEIYSKGILIQTVELVPGGSNIRVSNENKEEYLNALAQYRLATRVQKEIEAFVKGLNEIIPEGLLTNFDENELEILMCGKSTFQVQDLKSFHVVTIADDDLRVIVDKTLTWFWSTVENMTDEERGRLLQFTTGSSLLPHGGFKELQPAFRITLTHSFGKLPIAHTCFNEICLSIHRTYEQFQKSFLTAINEGSEGFGFM